MPANVYRLADGTRVPSVTTITSRFKDSGGLIHWAWDLGMQGKDYRAERDKAADSGTLAHEMIEAEIRGKPWEAPAGVADETLGKATAGYEQYQTWRDQTRLELVESEVLLVSEAHRFGGQIDAIGRIGDELCILDWKTSNAIYPEMLVQGVAYMQLWNENHPDRWVTGGIHIGRFSKEFGDFAHHHFGHGLAEVWETFLKMRDLYDDLKALKARVR